MATHRRWRRRFTYIVVTLIWLFLISLPTLTFLLAARQQLQVGQDDRNHVRLFVIQESFAEGIGLEWVRPSPAVENCTQTSVRYFMWVGEAENVFFCQCFDPQSQAAQSATQGACLAPPDS